MCELARLGYSVSRARFGRDQPLLRSLAASVSIGPLMDRIDIHVEMVRVPFQKLTSLKFGAPSTATMSS